MQVARIATWDVQHVAPDDPLAPELAPDDPLAPDDEPFGSASAGSSKGRVDVAQAASASALPSTQAWIGRSMAPRCTSRARRPFLSAPRASPRLR